MPFDPIEAVGEPVGNQGQAVREQGYSVPSTPFLFLTGGGPVAIRSDGDDIWSTVDFEADNAKPGIEIPGIDVLAAADNQTRERWMKIKCAIRSVREQH